MSTSTPRTAVSTQVAADGNRSLAVTFEQLERMAATVAKSGLFAVKTPEAALSLMLIAQAEGIHPAQAMMDYDVIEGKPSLKSSAMLTRFLRAGGQVEWLECSDAKVTGRFTSPKGKQLSVTWDDARVKTAGLASRPNHQKFPMQMKRARCISEGIRALWPVTQLYTPEEFADTPDSIDVTPQRMADAVKAAVASAQASATALTAEEGEEHFNAMKGAKNQAELASTFAAAWKHAGDAKDAAAREAFKAMYDARKAELAAAASEEAPT